MYIVRDIFHLKFGHYRQAKALLDEAANNNLFPETSASRILTDFTGDSYRLIFEEGFDSLANYEKFMAAMGQEAWQLWYEKFKIHVVSSHREILRQIMWKQ
ncbi:MAG TPA: hypothetical protein VK907_12895 [Phnomibacter sp.]|nr:hypothetical protein [Phnomibacter sp.]